MLIGTVILTTWTITDASIYWAKTPLTAIYSKTCIKEYAQMLGQANGTNKEKKVILQGIAAPKPTDAYGSAFNSITIKKKCIYKSLNKVS